MCARSLAQVGVNDLFAHGDSARAVWDGGLRAMYDEALSRGARVVGMLPLPTGLVSRWAGGEGELHCIAVVTRRTDAASALAEAAFEGGTPVIAAYWGGQWAE